MLTIFGAFALLLACIGLYGVTSYAVSRQRNEIGVRVALGARPAQVQGLILRHVVGLAVTGLAVGVPLATAVAPLVDSLLFGIAATNVVVIGASSTETLRRLSWGILLGISGGANHRPPHASAGTLATPGGPPTTCGLGCQMVG